MLARARLGRFGHETMEDVRRGAAVVTSVFWFVLTGGVGAVLVPGWLTGWQARQPYPYWGFVRVLGIVLIALGLIPPVHVFAQFVRAGGTPMPGANAVVGAGQLAPGPTS